MEQMRGRFSRAQVKDSTPLGTRWNSEMNMVKATQEVQNLEKNKRKE